MTEPFRYHARCDACTFNLDTNDYEMRAVLVGQHRTHTGHDVTLTTTEETQ